MDDDKTANSQDSRQMCKYGSKCYQKNPDHTKRFKHPVKQNSPSPVKSPNRKRMKLDVAIDKRRDTPSPKPKAADTDSANSDVEKQDEPPSPSILSETDDISNDKLILDSPDHSRPQDVNANGFHAVPSDIPGFINEKFLVQMPADFYSFFDFCRSISKGKNPANVLKDVNLILVGPFDVLNGSLPKRSKDSDYLVHWRYFYDPPEFQTIVMSPDKSDYHLGYFRDCPSDAPCFVASNEAANNCEIKSVAANIFGAVLRFLENTKKKSPFTSIACQKIITPLKEWANKHKFSLEAYSESMKKRQRQVVAKTFHNAGIVVHIDKNSSVGYRTISENNARLKVLMERVDEAENDAGKLAAVAALQPIITNAHLATDECDFGTGLELGIDFFCSGHKSLHSFVKSLMCVAYSMLKRDAFGNIIMAHLENRRKGCKLSAGDL